MSFIYKKALKPEEVSPTRVSSLASRIHTALSHSPDPEQTSFKSFSKRYDSTGRFGSLSTTATSPTKSVDIRPITSQLSDRAINYIGTKPKQLNSSIRRIASKRTLGHNSSPVKGLGSSSSKKRVLETQKLTKDFLEPDDDLQSQRIGPDCRRVPASTIPAQFRKLLEMTRGTSPVVKNRCQTPQKTDRSHVHTSILKESPEITEAAEELEAGSIPHSREPSILTPGTSKKGSNREKTEPTQTSPDPETDDLLLQTLTKELGLDGHGEYQLIPRAVPDSLPNTIVICSSKGYQIYDLRKS